MGDMKWTKLIQAKKLVFKDFSHGADPRVLSDSRSEDFFVDTLDSLAGQFPFDRSPQNEALSRFLYAGCLKFERWFAPSPYVVTKSHHERFARFVEALVKVEGSGWNNTATFELHRIRNELYTEFDEMPLSAVSMERVLDYERRMNSITAPPLPLKRQEFHRELEELKAIITGLGDKSLRTVIKTRLPYVLHISPARLSLTWKGLDTEVVITPEFYQSSQSFVSTNGAAQGVGASRWQEGASNIEIRVSALIDGAIETDSLQAIPDQDRPFSGWPKCFTFLFELVHEVAWRLRSECGGERRWIPAPRDLGDAEFFLCTSQHSSIIWERKGSPANLIRAFTPPNQLQEINLGDLTPLVWSKKCRLLSSMYLELGDTNEALFWLNVGVEALFQERFVEIAKTTNRPELEQELASPKAFWGPAEEVVSSQFPDMAGKVQWPETEVHVSMYAKLKYLYKAVHMQTNVKELLGHYRVISVHRNELFHGVSTVRVSVRVVKEALSSFDWIEANMQLSMGNEGREA